ncbi:uncharacterized protein GMORB2_3515 [Geosmithia morbida]|uniref:Xaa-Pro dipeptidyl-peptidase C-terminal domain-containing protein n=1 Tax=Geosmithia morbida TaxID=1094350 RepID=A0A9P4YSC5_9HYPO|nr:uncharacterized protein GMORB2_3515 [Geosmithia morbida]KAF4120104.1 uncharacterized protein GMORB2_3515 [Geosmithia morbida]
MRDRTLLQLFAATAASLVNATPSNSWDQSVDIINGSVRIYGDDAYPVLYRRALLNDAPRARYPGFKQETLILKNGTVRREGARALSCDIRFERDQPMTLRDGTVIYTDVFRPVDSNASNTIPAIVAWSPYGKEIGGQWLDDFPYRAGVPLSQVSELQKFEAPDPAYWVCQGYAIVNPDARGAYSSDGNITFWGRQLAEDGYDFIEWVADQDWSSGKVGMSGNSWLSVSQWFIAAEHPPHLTAIAPWEGLTDLYRDSTNRGGVPSPAFQEAILTTFAGKAYVEDNARKITSEPFVNIYWEDKIARVDQITIPAYVVASYTNPVHTRGSFQGFRDMKSTEKWLRVHNTFEWPDYYEPAHVAELTSFFDYYLKGKENGWAETPRVRISVLDPGHEDEVNRVVADWPVPGLTGKTFYLSADGLSDTLPSDASSTSYEVATDSAAGSVSFSYSATDLTEIIGYIKVKLWVEADGSDDMDLDITIQKTDKDGNSYQTVTGGIISTQGIIRASMRALNKQLSTDFEPYQAFTSESLLTPGEIYPLEVGLWPTALRIHPGEHILLTISAHTPIPADLDLGFGSALEHVPAAGGTFLEGTNVNLQALGGCTDCNPPYVNAQRVTTPVSRNKGSHIFHFGGKYDSYVLMPLNVSSSSTSEPAVQSGRNLKDEL